MDIFAATRSQDGAGGNQDAFVIGRGPIPYAALCDGSGNAQQAAQKALRLFERLFAEASPEQIERFETWQNITRLLDSSLLGGPQSTFVAIAMLSGRIVGTCVGDSRLYLLPNAGDIQILTEEATKARLGSGNVAPFAIHHRVASGDVLVLMSDGAWSPLSLPKLTALRAASLSRHFSEFPVAILDAAGKHGRGDDMTAVALKVP